MPYLSASAVVIHYEEALYRVYAPLPLYTFLLIVTCVRCQMERGGSSSRSRDGSDGMDRYCSEMAVPHFSAHQHGNNAIPRLSFDALTPPHGSCSSSHADPRGPGGITPLMSAAISQHDGAAAVGAARRNSSAIIMDLVDQGANTELCTDFSGWYPIFGFPCSVLSLSLSVYFNGYFPGEPGLAGVY